MELNRHSYFMIGLVVLFAGIQLRMVESYVLNEKTSRFLAERMRSSTSNDGAVASFLPSIGPTPRRTIRPPEWAGFALISAGAVLILHSLAMQKPGG